MTRLRHWLQLAITLALLICPSASIAATSLVAITFHVPSARAQLALDSSPRTRVPTPGAREPGLGGDRRRAAETRGGSPAPPGMCPGIVVEGGGGAGGGAGGGGGQGNPNGGNAADGGDGAASTGDAASAADPSKQAETCSAGHPVDVATGRAFTLPLVDFELAVYEWDHSLTVMGFDARGALLPHVEVQGDDVFGSDVAPKLIPFVRSGDDAGYLAGYSYRSTRFLTAKFHGTERIWSCDELAIAQTSDVVLTRSKDTLTGRALKDGSSLWSVASPLSAVAGADNDRFMVIDWGERLRAKQDAELAAFDRNELGEISDEELMRICEDEANGPSYVQWLDAATGAALSREPVAGQIVAAHPCGDVVSRAGSIDTFKDKTFPARPGWPLLLGGGVCLDESCDLSVAGDWISRPERSLTKPNAILHRRRIYARHGATLTRLG